ncbi:MAG TPA: cell division protein FtsZ, partial [Candidatus Paceibacterota bacterium]|nr:cell division protein FtsZ [Candidatus Paceibacterota bacterium]
ARGVLFSVMGNDLKMVEINDAAKYVGELVDPSAKIIFGAMEDNRLKKGEIKVMVIAAGFNGLVKYNNEKQQMIFNEKERTEKIDKPMMFSSKKEEISKKINDDSLEVPAFLRRKK